MAKRTRRGWYKPAGRALNQCLDACLDNLEHLDTHWAAAIQEKGTVSCQPGCAWCCRNAFLCTPVEGMLISRYLLAYKLGINMATLHTHARLQVTLGAEGWFEESLNCTFLDETTRRCTVYPVRPLNCRLCLSLGDPRDCRQGEMRTFKTAQLSQAWMKSLRGLTQRLFGHGEVVAPFAVAVLQGHKRLTQGPCELAALKDPQDIKAFAAKWRPRHDGNT